MEQCTGMMIGMGGVLWLILIIVLLIGLFILAGTVLLLRPPGNRTSGEKHKYSIADILQERLARGEIDPDEYRERLKTLHNPR